MIDKNFLLNQSKTFCMLPWIHVMMVPDGSIYPCCVSKIQPSESKLIQDTGAYGSIEDDLNVTINNDKFKTLRLNMLNEVQTPSCEYCFKNTDDSSFRKINNKQFGHLFDQTVPQTNADGSIDDFKMRYFDIRFSNICNFKCRTCGPVYSSSWLSEYVTGAPIVTKPDSSANTLNKVLEHLDTIEEFYFAGGEPLLMDEHCVLLEELIKHKKTNIPLRYSTNASKLSYKNKNILDLWAHFDQIRILASLDHYGERAEYIRSGTSWGNVETNLKKIIALPNVNFGINTVLSIFNYYSLNEFYEYMDSVNIMKKDRIVHYWVIHMCYGPMFANPIIMPTELKNNSRVRLKSIPKDLSAHIDYVESKDCWGEFKSNFLEITKTIDNARNESFEKTFPELAMMIK